MIDRGVDVPGQQLIDPVNRVVGDPGEDVAQVGLGVKAERLGPSEVDERAGALSPIICLAATARRPSGGRFTIPRPLFPTCMGFSGRMG